MTKEEILKNSQEYLIKTYNRKELIFVKGKGCKLFDLSAKEYIDFVSGISTVSLGHCHPKTMNALRNQLKKIWHTSNLYQILPQIKLAKELSILTKGMRSFFCNSGAEANESAIKLAKKWGKEKNKNIILSAYNSFHGRTIGALSATAQQKYQKNFLPLLDNFKYFNFNDFNSFKEVASDKVCAVILEIVQCEGGINIIEKNFLESVYNFCKENNILFILDEVQTGIGRCGKMFAYQNFNVEPDIITLAKALGNGFPIGAMLAKKEVADYFEPGDHASTFGGNFLSCAVALSVLKTIKEEKILEKLSEKENILKNNLIDLQNKFKDEIKEVRGLGFVYALEFNKDIAPIIVEKAQQKFLILNNLSPSIIRIVPPLNINNKYLKKGLYILSKAIEEVI